MILEQKMHLYQDFSKNIGVVQDPAREPEKMLKNSSFGKKINFTSSISIKILWVKVSIISRFFSPNP